MWQLGATVFLSETLFAVVKRRPVPNYGVIQILVKMDQTPRAAGIKDAYIDMESEPECIFVW